MFFLIHSNCQLVSQFRQDCAKLSNEKTFDEGIDYWRSLFYNDSIIEMNDRVFAGRSNIDGFFEMHKSVFRRIQFDIIGETSTVSESYETDYQHSQSTTNSYEEPRQSRQSFGDPANAEGVERFHYSGSKSVIFTRTQNHRILSVTLYATYVPRDPLGCSSMMRWLAIFWFHPTEHKISKWLMTSPTSLLEWEEQLVCSWVADSKYLDLRLKGLMNGMYRDSDVSTMVNEYYSVDAELIVDESSVEGLDNIINWYNGWNKLGISNVLNVIDELDIIGNTVLVRMVTIASHSSGKCSQSYHWYGLFRFNGHGQIIHEQRFYDQERLKAAMQVLSNCGDMSPQKTQQNSSTRRNSKDEL